MSIHSLSHCVLTVLLCFGFSVCFPSFHPEDQEKSLQLIKYLVPDVLAGSLLDVLSGHALSAASASIWFLWGEREESGPVFPLPVMSCTVRKAQKPGWFLDNAVEDPTATQVSSCACLGTVSMQLLGDTPELRPE